MSFNPDLHHKHSYTSIQIDSSNGKVRFGFGFGRPANNILWIDEINETNDCHLSQIISIKVVDNWYQKSWLLVIVKDGPFEKNNYVSFESINAAIHWRATIQGLISREAERREAERIRQIEDNNRRARIEEEQRIEQVHERAQRAEAAAARRWQHLEAKGIAASFSSIIGLIAECKEKHTLELSEQQHESACLVCKQTLSVTFRKLTMRLCARQQTLHAFHAGLSRCPVCFPTESIDVACIRCGETSTVVVADLDAPCPACRAPDWAQSLYPRKASTTTAAPAAALTSAPCLTVALGTSVATGAPVALQLGDATTTNHHLLVGGRTGSGKSVFLHSFILDLAERYSPDELQFHLLDFKGGVEFADYVDLPHVRSLNLSASRLWGLSVLDALLEERDARTALFVRHRVQDFAALRALGAPLPRIVLVIDEFQVLMGGNEAIATHAQRTFQNLIRTARSFGIHLVLASQTASIQDIDSTSASQVGVRIGFRMSEHDSTRVIGNPAAARLERAGDFVLNVDNGAVERNTVARGAFVDAAHRRSRIVTLQARTPGRRPVVLHAPGTAAIDDVDGATGRAIVLGPALHVTRPMAAVTLERERRHHMLLVGGFEPAARLLTVILLQQRRVEIEAEPASATAIDLAGQPNVVVLDVARRHRLWTGLADRVLEIEPRVVVDVLRASLSTPATTAAASSFLVIPDLLALLSAADGDRDFRSAFENVLLRGPDVGVHVVAGVDAVRPAARLLGQRLDDFGYRVLFTLDDAAQLRPANAQRLEQLEPGSASLVTPTGERFFHPLRVQES